MISGLNDVNNSQYETCDKNRVQEKLLSVHLWMEIRYKHSKIRRSSTQLSIYCQLGSQSDQQFSNFIKEKAENESKKTSFYKIEISPWIWRIYSNCIQYQKQCREEYI